LKEKEKEELPGTFKGFEVAFNERRIHKPLKIREGRQWRRLRHRRRGGRGEGGEVFEKKK